MKSKVERHARALCAELARVTDNQPVLGHWSEIGLLYIEHVVGVAESAHNPALNVPEIALLGRVGTCQLVDILLWRNDDPFLAQQNLGQSCPPLEE
jgi:hypothetical protein